jgi:hypothetical protein
MISSRFVFGGILWLNLQVKSMKEPVYDRGKDNCYGDKKNYSREERISCCKQLTGVTMQLIDRSHATKNHSSINGSIDPG